ncbi:uncharacterized protein LOC132889659 isoform X2 [Neoarius graeffei]|uniref:uncharacterized protein LOC132889659 isoform X2 n=1 Tax=Neoarius graeffei TaxID=443677 RepID=UPI00298C7D38|nr:uncharacterized protein LOC132889659 isoform X2 [Neoarius graeffei]
MWKFWILLLACNLMPGTCIDESWTDDIEHLDLTYGQQLSITLSSVTAKLKFIPVNKPQATIIWSKGIQAKKGQVISSEEERRFIINFVTFDDQGNYTELNVLDEVEVVHSVMVLSKRRIQKCMPGKNLSISLDGLSKDDVKLQYSSKDFNLTLVEHGSPVGNSQPGYWGRIHMTTKNIQVHILDGSDVGMYTLRDRENNKVMIVTLNIGGCGLKTTQLKLMHGEELCIKLPIWFKKLEFNSVNEVQSDTWPRCSEGPRKSIKGSDYERQFIIKPVTFDDQGNYTRWNYRNHMSSIYKLEVVSAHRVQDCVVGNTLNISLDSLSKDSVSLYFTNQKVNGTLVERGSLADNLPDLFKERIQITSSNIQVLKTEESDMGNYTLTDGEGRTVKVITPNFVYESNPLLVLLLLLFIPPCICFCYGNKIFKKCKKTTSSTTNSNTNSNTRSTTRTANASTAKFENQKPLLASSSGSRNLEAPVV